MRAFALAALWERQPEIATGDSYTSGQPAQVPEARQ
jgi:hypothetical protein